MENYQYLAFNLESAEEEEWQYGRVIFMIKF